MKNIIISSYIPGNHNSFMIYIKAKYSGVSFITLCFSKYENKFLQFQLQISHGFFLSFLKFLLIGINS